MHGLERCTHPRSTVSEYLQGWNRQYSGRHLPPYIKRWKQLTSRFEQLGKNIGIGRKPATRKGTSYRTVAFNHDIASVVWVAKWIRERSSLPLFRNGCKPEQRASSVSLEADGAKWIASRVEESAPMHKSAVRRPVS